MWGQAPGTAGVIFFNFKIKLEINNKKGYVIVFRCKKCGAIRKNKAAKDDNMDLLIELSSKH